MLMPLRQAQDRVAQDLVGPAQLLDFALERLQPILVAGGCAAGPLSSARLLAASAPQGLGRAADLASDGGHLGHSEP
jgi:hypothetical protein